MVQELMAQSRFEKTGNLSSVAWSTSYILSRGSVLFLSHPLQEAIQSLRISGSASASPSGRVNLLQHFGHLWQLCSVSHETVPTEPDPVQPGPVPVAPGHRSRELKWAQTHKEVLRQFAEQWVVLEGEEIIAHGKDLVRIVREARARGIPVPYVFYVEDVDEEVVRIGL